MRLLKLLYIVLFITFLSIGCGSVDNTASTNSNNNGNDSDNGNSNNNGNDIEIRNEVSDIVSPTVPADLNIISISLNHIELSWSASSDDVGVVGYRIYRNGNFFKSTTAVLISDSALNASSEYCYTVTAYDAADNESDHSTEVCDTTLNDPWGNLLGNFNGVNIYSNENSPCEYGNEDSPGCKNSIDNVPPIDLGTKWQSVEYVRRYYYSIYGVNLSSEFKGDATTWFSNASIIRFDSHINEESAIPPRVGDILVSEASFGHVAIVRSVSEEKGEICVAHQNFKNTAEDVNKCMGLSKNESNGTYVVSAFNNDGGYPVKGWLRIKGFYASSSYTSLDRFTNLYNVIGDGMDVLIGEINTVDGDKPLLITDITLTTDNTLYGVSYENLYIIDVNTAIASLVGGLGIGLDYVNALVSDGDNLYGATISGNFLSINAIDGKATIIGEYGSGYKSSGDLVLSTNSNTLYASVSSPEFTNDILVTVDPVTGNAVSIMPDVDTGFKQIYGLTFFNDELYGLGKNLNDESVLIRLDTVTSKGEFVRFTEFTAFGAASPISN